MPSHMTGDVAMLYQQYLAYFAPDSGISYPLELASSDDLYTYGRALSQYVQGILIVFRLTGDLVLLDHVDMIAERMRQELRDGWRDTQDGTDGTRDGYLNWVWRHSTHATYAGKDTHEMDEMMTHGLVALIAYALDQNRDLPSPSGRDYAAHADFWRDYLVNHFEAKWRERTGVSRGFPIMIRSLTHPYHAWMKYHYYMWKLTGERGYLDEANRMADVFWDSELRATKAPAGTAYVWAHGVLAEGSNERYLQPTIYARYLFGHFIEFHFEGFHRWASEKEMQRFTRTITELIRDRPDPIRNGFAGNVGGGTNTAGLVSRSSDERLNIHRFSLGSYGLMTAWDSSQRFAAIISDLQEALGSDPAPQLTAGLFIDAWQNGENETP